MYTNLQEIILLRRDGVERNISSIRFLTYKHSMSMTEGATPNILSTQTNIKTYKIYTNNT